MWGWRSRGPFAEIRDRQGSTLPTREVAERTVSKVRAMYRRGTERGNAWLEREKKALKNRQRTTLLARPSIELERKLG